MAADKPVRPERATVSRRTGRSGSRPLDGPYPVTAHPRVALALLCLSLAAAGASHFVDKGYLLTRNWLFTTMVTATLLVCALWAIPRFAPKLNAYLWTEDGGRVHVGHSIAVALVSFFLVFVVVSCLLLFGYFRHPGITAHWDLLWQLVAAAATLPMLIGIYIGLQQIGVTRRFKWMDATGLFLVSHGGRALHFNDRGRVFIMVVAAVVIMTVQGGIVLTGGLSRSFFTVVLVSTGTVAAMASERPAYAIFTAILCWCAAAISQVVGSYEPLPGTEYATAHFSMFSLTLLIGLLIDLGRKGRAKHRE